MDTLVRKQHTIKNPSAWLMTSMRSKQPCQHYARSGICLHGDNCKYMHEMVETSAR